MKLTRLAAALCAAFAGNVFAADLLQIYQDAERADPQYASAKAAYQAGLEKLPQARAGLKPKVNLDGGLTANYVDNRIAKQSAGFGSADISLTLAQPIYRPQNNILVQQAELTVAQVETQLNLAKQDLILRVAQAYFDVLLAQDNTEVSKAQKIAISEQLAQAKRNFEVGTATVVDVHEAQARYDLATSQEIANANDLEVKRRALEQLIAKVAPPLDRLKDKVALPRPTPDDMEQWVQSAHRQNLQVAILKTSEDIAVKEIERNQADYKPTVDLIGSLSDSENSRKRDQTFAQRQSSAAVGFQLNYPIWEGGLRNSRVREAVANREKARFDVENARRQAAQAARQGFLGVTSGIAQVRALEQAVVSTQSQLDSTKLGQEVGVRTGIDVLNAQQQLFSSRRDLYSARYNTILNQLRLKSAAGYLSTNDLAEINANLTTAAGPTSGPAQSGAVQSKGPTGAGGKVQVTPPKPDGTGAAPDAASPVPPVKPIITKPVKPAPRKPKSALKPPATKPQN